MANSQEFLPMFGSETIQRTGSSQGGQLHFLGYGACHFVPTFKELVDSAVSRYRSETGIKLNCHIPMGCSHTDEYDGIWDVDNIDEFPDVVASLGFGDFFRKEFVDRFVEKGYFRSAWSGPVNQPFEKAGFGDPDGWYTIYAVFTHVMMVDLKRLGDRPIPRRWSDLLQPCFQDSLMVNGAEGLVAEVPLLYFFKEHGEEGLIKLAANIVDSRHPAQLTKAAVSSGQKGAAVYIIPWFFAQARTMPEHVRVVWPDDGAITNPIYILVKESKRTEVDAIVQCITGPELGARSAQACFPALNPKVDNKLPEEASFKWLGWDYIRANDMEELKEYTSGIFLDAWRHKGQGDKATGGNDRCCG